MTASVVRSHRRFFLGGGGGGEEGLDEKALEGVSGLIGINSPCKMQENARHAKYKWFNIFCKGGYPFHRFPRSPAGLRAP